MISTFKIDTQVRKNSETVQFYQLKVGETQFTRQINRHANGGKNLTLKTRIDSRFIYIHFNSGDEKFNRLIKVRPIFLYNDI